MSDQDQWDWLRTSLGGIRADIAVVISRLDRIEQMQTDHEQRIRQLEADVGNNKLILRAVSSLAVIIGSAAFAVMGSLVKTALGG